MHQRYDCVELAWLGALDEKGAHLRIGSSCRAGVAFCREALFAPEGSRKLLETAEQRGYGRLGCGDQTNGVLHLFGLFTSYAVVWRGSAIGWPKRAGYPGFPV
jgi:hypothetical protein